MSNILHIGLDAKRIVANATGLGNYGRTLANDLAMFANIDLHLYAPDQGKQDLRQLVTERSNLHYVFSDKKNALAKALWRSKGIVRQLQHDRIDIFHGLSGELPIGIKKTGIKTVVTIHDLIFLRHPEYYNYLDVMLYKWKFHKTLIEADRIIAISECTRRDICEYAGIDEQQINVIYQSCNPRFHDKVSMQTMHAMRAKYALPKKFILNVGSIEKRKNVLLAVNALCYLPNDICLVIVGKYTDYVNDINKVILKLGLSDRVKIFHGVPDKDLHAFYNMADIFVYPSRYEGFGIPIIEAINAGIPVVAATGSCLEEAGGPDCLYVSPDDPVEMANAIMKLNNESERTNRVELSRQYITRFQNLDVAGQIRDIYINLMHA
ncbi:MAG: glycosyltransferase family 4 protein [Prevotellaceae bacterium]|nr:glycosyltransferase family 4 protein [Prevotellaceae bacterium]